MIRLRLPTSARWPLFLGSGADANELAAMHDPAKRECGQTREAHTLQGGKSLLKGCASEYGVLGAESAADGGSYIYLHCCIILGPQVPPEESPSPVSALLERGVRVRAATGPVVCTVR